MKIAAKVLSVVIVFLIFIGVIAATVRVLMLAQYLPVPPTNIFDAGFMRNPILTLLHILPGVAFLILGPLQFVRKIRTSYPVFHRWSGYVYVVSGVFVGISAFILSIVIAYGGIAETTAGTFFSSLFLIFLGIAIYQIRRRKVASHREWMIRAFALGLTVATIRPIVIILSVLTGHPLIGNLSSEILGMSFWLVFSLHLVIAELWIRLTRVHSTTRVGKETSTEVKSVASYLQSKLNTPRVPNK